jgi:hypothetical protein
MHILRPAAGDMLVGGGGGWLLPEEVGAVPVLVYVGLIRQKLGAMIISPSPV